MIIATNITAHPAISRPDNTCPNISQPEMAEITDYKLIIKDATTGFMSFWPIICSVYPTPVDNTPT